MFGARFSAAYSVADVEADIHAAVAAIRAAAEVIRAAAGTVAAITSSPIITCARSPTRLAGASIARTVCKTCPLRLRTSLKSCDGSTASATTRNVHRKPDKDD